MLCCYFDVSFLLLIVVKTLCVFVCAIILCFMLFMYYVVELMSSIHCE